MAFETPINTYNGKIREITLSSKGKSITVGGETSLPFHLFEGEMPNPPRIAMEVYDCPPEEWAEAALEPFADVINNPVLWAQKCIKEYGAELICLQLLSTDPNGLDRSAKEAAETVKKVAEAIDVPLIVWGTSNVSKDTEVLKEVCETCQDIKLAIGPVEEANYKKIGAAVIGYGHTIIASSPIDINMAKQLNILLGSLGMPDDKILIDPTASSVGYGIEYCYSVMERIRIAALTQQDERLQFPMICNIARETWKVKEAKTSESEEPNMGDAKKRGILLEAISANALLSVGADILIMRHPEAIEMVREMIKDLTSSN